MSIGKTHVDSSSSKAKQKSRKMSEIPARHLRGESPWSLYEEPPREGADYITWPVPSNDNTQHTCAKIPLSFY